MNQTSPSPVSLPNQGCTQRGNLKTFWGVQCVSYVLIFRQDFAQWFSLNLRVACSAPTPPPPPNVLFFPEIYSHLKSAVAKDGRPLKWAKIPSHATFS
jgi:hypothetical protein